MPDHLFVAALGGLVRIDLSALSEDDRRSVEHAWRDASAVGEEADRGASSASVVQTAEGASSERMLEDLSQRVTRAAIESGRGQLWMLHAAAVALDDGRVVVLIGPSGRGKTTAALTLATHFGYVSDETVGIESDGRVLPYRKPLSVITQAGEPKEQRAASDLSLLPLPAGELRLSAIVLLDRRTDAPDAACIEAVDLGDAIGELVAQTSYLPSLKAPLQTLAEHVASAGGVQRVIYREAGSLAALIPVLADSVLPPGECLPRALSVAQPPVAALHGPGVRFVRTEVADALELSDPERLVLLHSNEVGTGMVRVLAGIAPELWRAANGVGIDTLVDAAVAAYGAPEAVDSADVVAGAVAELVAEGVLAQTEPLAQTESSVWMLRDDVAWVDSGDRIVALALGPATVPARPTCFEGSAAMIWLAVADGGDTGTIIERVAVDAGVDDPQLIAGDVTRFLAQLVDEGLIEARIVG